MKLCSSHVAILQQKTSHALQTHLLDMGKSAKSFYAVRVGRTPGQIFRTWPECEAQVKGYPGAQFKGFKCESEALSYLGQSQQRGGILGIGLASGNIQKRTAQRYWDQGLAPALHVQHACSGSARLLVTSSHESRQASSSASQLGRPCADPKKTYCLEFDGGARGNPGTAGAGAVLYDETNKETWHLVKASHVQFLSISENLGSQTNNHAEYTALIRGLQAALMCGVKHIRVKGDSKLVVMQLNGAWQVHNAGLAPLHKQATVLRKQFDSFKIDHIFREANRRADQLSNVAMDGHGWTGLKDGQGNVWPFLGSDAYNSADAVTPATPADAPQLLRLPTMYVTRQGNSLAALSRPCMY